MSPEHAEERASRRLKHRTPLLYRLADGLTEGLLYFLVVFSPWAFGSTQAWSVWTTNVAGYLLAGLLVTKWAARWCSSYTPPRWGNGSARWPVKALAGLTVLILAWCLVSALNARAVYLPTELRLEYRERYVSWLPHSYDATQTWQVFWTWLGLAGVFWAARDWLLGKTRSERMAEAEDEAEDEEPAALEGSPWEDAKASPRPVISAPRRLRRLLWVICLNGALLGVEGILQRLDGANKLLWLVEPRLNKRPESQFGPYAYRANAAQYLNLVWPVCLGFWWWLRSSRRRTARATVRVGGDASVLLLPCAAVIGASPVITMSRGGALVAAVNLVVGTVLLLVATRRSGRNERWAVLALLAGVLGLGGLLGWRAVRERFLAPIYWSWTGTDSGFTEVSLRCVFQTPKGPPSRPVLLAGLRNASGWVADPDCTIFLCLQPNGGLQARLLENWTNILVLHVAGFISQSSGKTVEATLVKSTNWLVYLDGEPVNANEIKIGSAPSLTTAVASSEFCTGRFLANSGIFPDRIYSATLFNRALSASEVKEVAGARRLAQGDSKDPVYVEDLTPWGPFVEVVPGETSLRKLLTEGSSGRSELYRNARQMAQDFSLLGCGPGAFPSLYRLYRTDPAQRDAAYLHDDWLELRITFGLIGFGLLLAALVLSALRWFLPGGIASDWPFAALLWLSLAGCLFHARFDFPFRIHSIVLLFVLLNSVALVVSRRGRKA
jgi:hypothetical protein